MLISKSFSWVRSKPKGFNRQSRKNNKIVFYRTCDEYNSREDDAKIEVVVWRFLECSRLDAVGQEAEDGAKPQEEGESSKQVLAELDPFWSLRRRSQSVETIPFLMISRINYIMIIFICCC